MADLDGDGAAELLSGDFYGQINVFPRNADGDFEHSTPLAIDGEALDVGAASTVEPADWNGDGVIDLLFGNMDGDVLLALGSRDGDDAPVEFAKPEPLLDATGEPITAPSGDAAPHVVDWDEDRRLDLLLGAQDGSVLWYRDRAESGSAELAQPLTLIGPLEWGVHDPERSDKRVKLDTFDWDFDGELDLIVGDYTVITSPEASEATPELNAARARLEVAKQAMKPLEERRRARTAEFVADLGREPTTNERVAAVRRAIAEIEVDPIYRIANDELLAAQAELARIDPLQEEHGGVWVYLSKGAGYRRARVLCPEIMERRAQLPEDPSPRVEFLLDAVIRGAYDEYDFGPRETPGALRYRDIPALMEHVADSTSIEVATSDFANAIGCGDSATTTVERGRIAMWLLDGVRESRRVSLLSPARFDLRHLTSFEQLVDHYQSWWRRAENLNESAARVRVDFTPHAESVGEPNGAGSRAELPTDPEQRVERIVELLAIGKYDEFTEGHGSFAAATVIRFEDISALIERLDSYQPWAGSMTPWRQPGPWPHVKLEYETHGLVAAWLIDSFRKGCLYPGPIVRPNSEDEEVQRRMDDTREWWRRVSLIGEESARLQPWWTDLHAVPCD